MTKGRSMGLATGAGADAVAKPGLVTSVVLWLEDICSNPLLLNLAWLIK